LIKNRNIIKLLHFRMILSDKTEKKYIYYINGHKSDDINITKCMV